MLRIEIGDVVRFVPNGKPIHEIFENRRFTVFEVFEDGSGLMEDDTGFPFPVYPEQVIAVDVEDE